MTYVHLINCNELRAVVCLEFSQNAPPDEVAQFKASFINSPEVLHSIDVTGHYDFMAEVAAPDMASFNEWFGRFAQPLACLTKRSETNFICKRYIRRALSENAIWVPTSKGLKRIDHLDIDKITAEGDYVRIHSKGTAWLLHATMHGLMVRLGSINFVQIHRSFIVRCSFIELLSHAGRSWTALLTDGSRQSVARGHVVATLATTHSANIEHTSAH